MNHEFENYVVDYVITMPKDLEVMVNNDIGAISITSINNTVFCEK